MSEVTSLYGFNLPCRICSAELLVGPTSEFIESGTDKELTAYWAAGAAEGDKAVGFSEGTGDSFECAPCHAVKWVKETAEMRAGP